MASSANSKTLAKRVAALTKMAQELRQGECFNVTRLNRLKSLCANPQVAGQFCLYLARLKQAMVQANDTPNHLDEKT